MGVIQLGLILVYMCVLLIKVCEDSTEICSTFGFGESATGLYLFFIFFGLSMVLLQFIVAVVQLVYVGMEDGSVRAIHLRSSGEPPKLTLRDGRKFHLFLSREQRAGFQLTQCTRLLLKLSD